MRIRLMCGAWLLSVALAGGSGSASALEPISNEKDLLLACEAKICGIANKKQPAGDDLKCDLNKTWTKRVIESGVSEKKISWGFGDARCSVNVGIGRADIVAAMTKPSHTIELSKHAVSCEVEREKEVIKINLTLAPKLQFKGGKLDKAWLNVSSIDGPSIVKGALWTAAKVEDNVGLFHSQIVRQVNTFLYDKCPARHPG